MGTSSRSTTNVAATHTAAGPAGGYFYQLQRALLRLAEMSNDDDSVGIETLDDVSGVTGSRLKFREQTKHTLDEHSKIGDREQGFWKTLAIWLSAKSAAREYFFVTRSAVSGEFLKMLLVTDRRRR